MLGRPEAVAIGRKRRADLGELERSHHPMSIPWMDRVRRGRVSAMQLLVRALRIGVVGALPAFTHAPSGACGGILRSASAART